MKTCAGRRRNSNINSILCLLKKNKTYRYKLPAFSTDWQVNQIILMEMSSIREMCVQRFYFIILLWIDLNDRDLKNQQKRNNFKVTDWNNVTMWRIIGTIFPPLHKNPVHMSVCKGLHDFSISTLVPETTVLNTFIRAAVIKTKNSRFWKSFQKLSKHVNWHKK